MPHQVHILKIHFTTKFHRYRTDFATKLTLNLVKHSAKQRIERNIEDVVHTGVD